MTYIGLNGNNIGAEGGKAIGEALKVNTSLTEILLQRNNIGDEGVGALSILPHVTEKINFNGLAFLIEVSKIVDIDF